MVGPTVVAVPKGPNPPLSPFNQETIFIPFAAEAPETPIEDLHGEAKDLRKKETTKNYV